MKKLRSILAVLLCLSLAACSQQPTSSQGGGAVAPGGGSLSSAPETSDPEDGFLQNDGQSVIENIPQEEQRNYFRKYIEPYYIVGLMYQTWSDPEEIEVQRYMKFYIYNESGNYWSENPITDGYSIPWYTVEDFITSYFDVSPGYLRSAENYDGTIACYRGMMTEGIGGGPGVTIERIEKDGDLRKFVCRGESGNLLSVTMRMLDENSFHYVAGEVLEKAEPASPPTDERVDPMALGDNAQVLTQHIVDTVFEHQDIAVGDYPPLSEARFTAFAMGVVKYLEDEAYQYHDIAYREDGYWHFQEDRLKGMVKEVFGAEDWEPNWGPDRESWPLEHSEENREYIAELAFDFWNYMECKFMATVIDTQNGKVIVDYDLYSSSLFPDQHKIATMSTNYSIRFREDDTPYLRYEGTSVESVSE